MIYYTTITSHCDTTCKSQYLSDHLSICTSRRIHQRRISLYDGHNKLGQRNKCGEKMEIEYFKCCEERFHRTAFRIWPLGGVSFRIGRYCHWEILAADVVARLLCSLCGLYAITGLDTVKRQAFIGSKNRLFVSIRNSLNNKWLYNLAPSSHSYHRVLTAHKIYFSGRIAKREEHTLTSTANQPRAKPSSDDLCFQSFNRDKYMSLSW
jgi:hypothetical protein